MNELILVLEENPEIQAVISASLKDNPIFINQELDPDYFLQQVQNLNPDLIFISNSDCENNYITCRKIREDHAIKNIPIILLVNAKDEIDEDLLVELQINGMLRKPFEASMLKDQISQYISLDENFGAEPDNGNDNFTFDMSSINSDLKEIKQQNHDYSHMDSKKTNKMPDSLKKSEDSSYAFSAGSNMDSLVLEDILIENKGKRGLGFSEDFFTDEFEIKKDKNEWRTDNENDFYLESEEIPEAELTETEPVSAGLEKLKLSGLEDKYAERKFFDENENTNNKLTRNLSDIDLENNDFEDPSMIWSNPPDLDQTPREGLTEISLKKTDFNPSFPKNLTPLEDNTGTIKQEDEGVVDRFSELDNSLLRTGIEESSHINGNDEMLLIDSDEKKVEKNDNIEDVEQSFSDSSLAEFDEGLINIRDADEEINSMVKESIEDQEIAGSETGLEELEDLSLQMESLEAEEEELKTEEKEIEKDLEKARMLDEGTSSDYPEDELTEYMVDELGDLLELDEDEDINEMDQDYSSDSIIKHALEEDVFESWDEAEDAFMGFDKESILTDDVNWADTETENETPTEKNYYSHKEGKFSFNEDELKEIVTSSVQNALEKSIASSLVELAVSEIKNNVSGRV